MVSLGSFQTQGVSVNVPTKAAAAKYEKPRIWWIIMGVMAGGASHHVHRHWASSRSSSRLSDRLSQYPDAL
jgi:hypothetical protein